MRKIAILFPGIGYHTDKPLLYFGRKLAKENGYKVLEVSYEGLPSGIKGNKEKMQEAFESALAQSKDYLEEYKITKLDDVLILSKSIGTVVAAAWQKETGIHAKNIYFTPLEETFLFAKEKSGIVFHGTKDPWAETEPVVKQCRDLALPLYLIQDANHSLEKDALSDAKMLEDVVSICSRYISGKGQA